jgi:drug/metabolite transporter (DMT)-like permease
LDWPKLLRVLAAFGAMVLATGLALSVLQRNDGEISWIGLRYAMASRLAYAIATVLIGVLLLGEGATLNIWKAVGGTGIVLLGLALVTSA